MIEVKETSPKRFELRAMELIRSGYYMKNSVQIEKEKGVVYYKAIFSKKNC